MLAILAVLTSIAVLLSLISFAAQRELFRNVLQLREALHIDDEARPANLGKLRDRMPSEFELPAALGGAAEARLLVLSSSCVTCQAIAQQIRQAVPDGIWIMVEDRTMGNEADVESGSRFMTEFGLTGPRTFPDIGGQVALSMGLDTTPVLLHISNGHFTDGLVLTSPRQFWASFPDSMVIGR